MKGIGIATSGYPDSNPKPPSSFLSHIIPSVWWVDFAAHVKKHGQCQLGSAHQIGAKITHVSNHCLDKAGS